MTCRVHAYAFRNPSVLCQPNRARAARICISPGAGWRRGSQWAMAPAAALALVLVVSGSSAGAATLTALERQHLVAHLEMTAAWLTDEVSGLSSPQLLFRPSPTSWNILEVLDHLIVVGPIYWDDLQKAIKGPPTSRSSSNTDADILWYGIDRTHRETAIPTEVPKGQLRDLGGALGVYRKLHERLLQYAKTTTD